MCTSAQGAKSGGAAAAAAGGSLLQPRATSEEIRALWNHVSHYDASKLLPNMPVITDQQQQGRQAQTFHECHVVSNEYPDTLQDNTASVQHARQTLSPLQIEQKQVQQKPQQHQHDAVKPSDLADQAATASSNFKNQHDQELPRAILQQWIEAAKEGDTSMLAKMLRQQPGLLNSTSGGLQCCALHWAAARGHANTLQQLLDWGADSRLCTATGGTALHSAAAAGRQRCVELLLTWFEQQQYQHAQELLQTTNEDGLTAAALAEKHGHHVVHNILQQAMGSSLPAQQPQEQQQQQQQQQAPAGNSSSSGQQLCTASSAMAQPCSAVPGNAVVARQSRSVRSGICPGFLLPTTSSSTTRSSSRAGQHLLQVGDSTAKVIPLNADQAVQQPAAVPSVRLAEPAAAAAAAAAAATGIEPRLGRAWLDAARAGNLPVMHALLQENPLLLCYCGQGTSYGMLP